jgi:hypothetical protein
MSKMASSPNKSLERSEYAKSVCRGFGRFTDGKPPTRQDVRRAWLFLFAVVVACFVIAGLTS